MKKYILKRIGQAFLTMVAVSIMVFLLTHLSGDPAVLIASDEATHEEIKEIRVQLGLDKPIYTQYWIWITGVVQGDFGQSLKFNMPASEMFLERFPNTVKLATLAMALAPSRSMLLS